jgi:hypothetical protein
MTPETEAPGEARQSRDQVGECIRALNYNHHDRRTIAA